jgi:hypothetical protein
VDDDLDLPSEDDVLEDLIDLRELEFGDRLFVVARIAPHPTAIRAVFEVSDDGDPSPKLASDLVPGSEDPYFWVEQYGEMLREYVDEAHRFLDLITTDEVPDDGNGLLGQAYEPDSDVGRAARQSAVGVRAHTGMFTEALWHASAEAGWPEDPEDAARLLELLVDANLAVSILEQLGGEPAIPDDVLAAWDPKSPGR